MKYVLILILTFCAAHGQTPAPQPAGGVESEWDLKKLLDALSAGARRLEPIMQQTNPQNWQDREAAQSYMPQWKGAVNEIQYLEMTAEKLAKEPERMPVALEVYFRLQSLETSISSLLDGIRKYQNPAISDLLQAALAENLSNRERLKAYLTELAQSKEEEFKVMDKEAQRCRATVSRQPPPATKPRSKH